MPRGRRQPETDGGPRRKLADVINHVFVQGVHVRTRCIPAILISPIEKYFLVGTRRSRGQ